MLTQKSFQQKVRPLQRILKNHKVNYSIDLEIERISVTGIFTIEKASVTASKSVIGSTPSSIFTSYTTSLKPVVVPTDRAIQVATRIIKSLYGTDK